MSSASFLIALREGFEAALIVSIVLAFVKKGPAPEMARAVWAGALGALAIATVIGVIIHFTIDGLTGDARSRTFAAICFSAAALLTWMIFWMRTNARHLKHELESKADVAVMEHSAMGLALVAFLAVLREGLETALFLVSAATGDDGARIIVGTLVGLAVAIVLGVLVYRGASHFDMRRFFQVTGVLIIVLAAGLLAKGVGFLQGPTVTVVYNVTGVRWLTAETEVGKFLQGIFGWDPAPSPLQFLVYVGYLVPVLVYFFRNAKPAPRTSPQPAPAGDAPAPPVASSSTEVPAGS